MEVNYSEFNPINIKESQDEFNLNKLYDKIYIISYVKNFEQRKNISKQLYHHGITNFEFVYSYNVSENVINNPAKLGIKHFSVTFTHYDIIKKSYELELNRILIFEDDVNFIKDENKFKEIFIEGFKNNADIVLYDYCKYNIDCEYKVDGYILASGYALNRNGMLFYIDNYEKSHFIIDQYIYCLREFKENNIYHKLLDVIWHHVHDINDEPYYVEIQHTETSMYPVTTKICYQNDLINLYNDSTNICINDNFVDTSLYFT